MIEYRDDANLTITAWQGELLVGISRCFKHFPQAWMLREGEAVTAG